MPKKKKIIKQPKVKQISKKESELEEEIEETIDNQFHEFIQPSTEFVSPVLEKVGDAPEPIDLEQELTTAPTTQENKEEPKYETSYDVSEYETPESEARKIINENMVIAQSTPIRIETAGTDLRPHREQTFQINPELQDIRQTSEGALETDYIAKAEKITQDNKLPFQQTQRKYKGKPI